MYYTSDLVLFAFQKHRLMMMVVFVKIILIIWKLQRYTLDKEWWHAKRTLHLCS